MQKESITIALCAGEASGDKLAADLVLQLRERLPQAEFYGIGGAHMAAAGVTIVQDYAPLAVMGYWDALRGLPRILRLRGEFLQQVAAQKPDIFIGVDAPDFNLRLARRLRRRGIKCVQYVAPSVWAWRRERLKKIAAAVDAVLCLLPFEPPLFTAAGVPAAHYVGHPAARRELPPPAAARERLGIPAEAQVVALLPGSRSSELTRHLPLLQQVVPKLAADHPDCHFVSALATPEAEQQLKQALPQVACGDLADILAAADSALVKSGTIALETAMAGIPHLVFYRASPMAAWLVRWRSFYIPYFNLPNILTRRFIVPELLLEDATPAKLVKEANRLLSNKAHRQQQQTTFVTIRRRLAAADTIPAEAVLGVLK